MSHSVPNAVVVRVPGKVNLQLSVGPKESDGFHGVVTVFQAISLFDDVTISRTEIGSGISVKISLRRLRLKLGIARKTLLIFKVEASLERSEGL